MCGIFAILFPTIHPSTGATLSQEQLQVLHRQLRDLAVSQARTIRHRGPDWSGIWPASQTSVAASSPAASPGGAILAHERLGLVGLGNGAQPIVSADGKLVLAVNGEIYNHMKYRTALQEEGVYDFQTESDCEVIMALYRKYCSTIAPTATAASIQEGVQQFIDRLEGMFSFVLWDEERQIAVTGRDHVGIIPLYTGFGTIDLPANTTSSSSSAAAEVEKIPVRFYASECKALVGIPDFSKVQEFPTGCFEVYDSKTQQQQDACRYVQYYQRPWTKGPIALASSKPSRDEVKKQLHDSLCDAVHSHMMCDTPYGVLLSGGLDSSVISAIAAKYAAKRIESGDQEAAWWPRLHSFAIGLEGAPDLKAAAEVAKALGTVHHQMHFTVQDGIDALKDVIYHTETFDVTTIRASTPMFLLARKIKAMGIKMVLSGEGSDELFGGYLYFHKAPSAEELHAETVRKLEKLHLYDCLRANKAMAAWGVEGRVPFLDKNFMDCAMSIDPQLKMIQKGKTIEKQILREAFESYLPDSVVWRQKEQFGDGVGYSWIDSLKLYAEEKISDDQMKSARELFPANTPDTKEAFLFRSLFEEIFTPATTAVPKASTASSPATRSSPPPSTPTGAAQQPAHDSFVSLVPLGGKSVACSTAEALLWDASLQQRAADPSGRAMAEVHQSD